MASQIVRSIGKNRPLPTEHWPLFFLLYAVFFTPSPEFPPPEPPALLPVPGPELPGLVPLAVR